MAWFCHSILRWQLVLGTEGDETSDSSCMLLTLWLFHVTLMQVWRRGLLGDGQDAMLLGLGVLVKSHDTSLLSYLPAVFIDSDVPCIRSANSHSIMMWLSLPAAWGLTHFLNWGLPVIQTLGNLKVDSVDSSLFFFIEDGFSPVQLWWKKNTEHTAGLLLPLFLTI